MKKFEVWLADLDPNFGTEAGKKRPVVIVQTDFLNGKHKSTIICPITTNVVPALKRVRVHLKAGDAGGLTCDSDILVDQIRAIDNRRFLTKLGTIPKLAQNTLCDNLRIVLDL